MWMCLKLFDKYLMSMYFPAKRNQKEKSSQKPNPETPHHRPTPPYVSMSPQSTGHPAVKILKLLSRSNATPRAPQLGGGSSQDLVP